MATSGAMCLGPAIPRNAFDKCAKPEGLAVSIAVITREANLFLACIFDDRMLAESFLSALIVLLSLLSFKTAILLMICAWCFSVCFAEDTFLAC